MVNTPIYYLLKHFLVLSVRVYSIYKLFFKNYVVAGLQVLGVASGSIWVENDGLTAEEEEGENGITVRHIEHWENGTQLEILNIGKTVQQLDILDMGKTVHS